MISLLLPTRNRPVELSRMIESVRATQSQLPWETVEIILYIDDDDLQSPPIAAKYQLKHKIGPRIRNITQMWNELIPLASGDIFCQANDDIIFKTHDWDQSVEREFHQCPDKILMVHGDDLGGQRERFGPHPFVHRKWIDMVGYFIPPYFSSDFGDTWLNDVANALGRRKYIPIEIDHIHPCWGKGSWDQTHLERLTRHREDNPEFIYAKMLPQRNADIEKLRSLMDSTWTL